MILSTNEVEINSNTKNGIKFSATILLDSKEVILEQGFAYGLHPEPSLQDLILKVSDVSRSKFAIVPEDVLIPDTTYFVRSFVKTRKYLIYGNEVSFYSNGSEPPLIEGIKPGLAFWGDTIMIVGKNFDRSGKNNVVWFNQFASTQTWGSLDTIYSIVPNELNVKSSELKVSLYGQQSENSKTFEIHSPIIREISNSDGQYPDTVTVSGDYFSDEYLKVFLNDIQCDVINANKKKISFVVPFLGKGGSYLLHFNQLQSMIPVKRDFKYNEQVIFGLSEDGVYYDDPMVITARNVDFRRIPAYVYIENVGMYSSHYLKYQDSLVFQLSNPWYTLQKYNSYSLNIGHSQEKLFSGSFMFKNPMFNLLENETVVNGFLKVNRKGHTYDGLCYISGPIIESHYPTINFGHNNGWHLDYKLLPGFYQFYYEDILGRSEVGDFIIKQPALTTLNKQIYSRNDNLLVIDGIDMPVYTLAGSSYFKIKHLESNRVFDFNGRSYNLKHNEIKPYWLVGKGEFEIYLELRNQRISNSIQFTFTDDFLYVDSVSGFRQPIRWYKQIVKWGNNLVCSDGYNSYLIDLTSKQSKEVNSIGREIKDLFSYNGSVYAHTTHDSLYRLSHSGNNWDKVIDNLDNEYIDVVYTDNDAIFLISATGQVYTLEDTEIEKYGIIQNYQSTSYVYSKNNELFFFRDIEVEIYNRITFTSKGKLNINFPDLRRNEKLFVPTKYGLSIYSNRTLVVFDAETRKLKNMSEYNLPNSSNNILFSNEEEELFLLNEHFLYRYNP